MMIKERLGRLENGAVRFAIKDNGRECVPGCRKIGRGQMWLKKNKEVNICFGR
ncbi:hypothetical protein NYE33_00150 [Paenibacillus sp. FSL R10-2199]|jgi:hypothetical protein|uniref:hypothetical protein n=1 Tax=Paenibacillus sp. FSL R10-2199 TaxID=2975348 RepID=UPI0030F6574E